jgi:hypothetical protein
VFTGSSTGGDVVVTFRPLDLERMNYRLTEVDQRTSFLLDKVEEYDQQLASQLKDAIWTQVLQAFAQATGTMLEQR